MSMLSGNYAPPIRHRASWRVRLSRWLFGPPAHLMRDPFWWPMAEPPLPSEDWRDLLYELSVPVDLQFIPYEKNPREDLRYLDICPPEVSGWLHQMRGRDL